MKSNNEDNPLHETGDEDESISKEVSQHWNDEQRYSNENQHDQHDESKNEDVELENAIGNVLSELGFSGLHQSTQQDEANVLDTKLNEHWQASPDKDCDEQEREANISKETPERQVENSDSQSHLSKDKNFYYGEGADVQQEEFALTQMQEASDAHNTNHVKSTEGDRAEADTSNNVDNVLGEAIGNALESIYDKRNDDNEHHAEDFEARDEAQFTSNDDDQLKDAIGDAFENIITSSKTTEGHENTVHEEVDHNRKQDMGIENNTSSEYKENKEDEDSVMERAIHDALSNVFSHDNEELKTITKQPSRRNSLALRRQSLDNSSEITNLVSNVVSQMASSENPQSNETLPIPADVLQELAAEITSQVQDQLEEDGSRKVRAISDMPQIEDHILAHFQNEAYKEETGNKQDTKSSIDERTVQTALASVVKNAIYPSGNIDGSLEKQENSAKNEGTDLEQLQMNAILQNAFNMAMENPQELLSNLGGEENQEQIPLGNVESQVPKLKPDSSSHIAGILSKLKAPLGASSSLFLNSLNRASDVSFTSGQNDSSNRDQHVPKTDDITVGKIPPITENLIKSITNKSISDHYEDAKSKKTLSIAETLALHRSSMSNIYKKDYSSIESLEQALVSDSRRSSLLQKAQNIPTIMQTLQSSSSSENSLTQVLRQATESLSSIKSIGSFSYLTGSSISSIVDIISSYRVKGDERVMLDPLCMAKEYLSGTNSDGVSKKAVTVIDKVINLFKSSISYEKSTSGINMTQFDPSMALGSFKQQFISTINKSILSVMSGFADNSFRRSSPLSGIKARTDSLEYKERIRLENRERKKKWREENAERNKDNDLRSRVLKRANLIYGEKDTPEKKFWIEEEFGKRREKRIAKQKKEEAEKHSKGGLDDTPYKLRRPFGVKDSNPYAEDPLLIRAVTDTFNIVSCLCYREEPSVAATATAAATASSAAFYSIENKLDDFQTVESAVSQIVTSLMEEPSNDNHRARIFTLSKGASASPRLKLHNISQSTTLDELQELQYKSLSKDYNDGPGNYHDNSHDVQTTNERESSDFLPSSLLDFQNLNLTKTDRNKRKNEDSWDTSYKRSRPSSPERSRNNSTTGTPLSDIAKSTISQMVTSSALKFPSYRKPEFSQDNITSQVKKEQPTLSLLRSSPFLSNKTNLSASKDSDTQNHLSRLKKPASFQRPSYSGK
ncbi:Piso0_003325 [Millerozyma farinosa CBS 7064]|uniref:Piso0_003325 protein n=1 Tax=Pichia sorbitophila (strain ATCC MYA-4447 / BCRC 22081 / CBS 7064 / NBRC 10061 / NRRL Y-12695) TaxID=559304 RepID=G8YHT6_PICSO|nr:Piso0_003325 [Millerozyma farinosa CBS 7064]CCE80988.1 Piso0_003325 [Millerozyma farinosa CBS 7064]